MTQKKTCFLLCQLTVGSDEPEWRNWYTRTTQNRVPSGLRVQVPSPAPWTYLMEVFIMQNRPRVGVIVENAQGEVLVGRRTGSHAPKHSIPGGSLEIGENF